MSYESEILQKVAKQDLETKGFRVFSYGLDGTTPTIIKVNSNGELIGADLGHYRISDQAVGTTSYYGYVDKDGNWFIMKSVITGAVTNYTYARGTTDYATNWTGRAGLSYSNFATCF